MKEAFETIAQHPLVSIFVAWFLLGLTVIFCTTIESIFKRKR